MTALPGRIDTAVIGAGQSGLTMSWYLQRSGRDHVLLDRRATLGGSWQDRWDEFRLVGPNWTASFPGAPYDGEEPDAFMPRDEIAARVAGYAAAIGAPIVLEAGVERLTTTADGGFRLETVQGDVDARQVIVAIGGFHLPHIPPMAAGLPARVLSLHAHAYRREGDLPPGAVLVVGSGQTGVQLVEELRAAHRAVYLCAGATGRVPRRYRGHDIFYWLWQLAEYGERHGTVLPPVATLPDPRRRLAGNVALSGHDGGHETDLRRFGLEGTTLLGRLVAIDGEKIRLGDDLGTNLAFADRYFDEKFRDLVDGYIAAAGIDAPTAEPAAVTTFEPTIVDRLDLRDAGISTVLWTTGYRQDLGWIDLPITDELGFARQVRGVSEVPGLTFMGSLWQHDQTSATLFGMPRDARWLAEHLGLTPPEDDAAPAPS